MKFTPPVVQPLRPAPGPVPSHPAAPSARMPSLPIHKQTALPNAQASIAVERIILEGFGPVAAHEVRNGFAQAWKDAPEHPFRTSMEDAFAKGLDLDLPAHATGRQIGSHLAHALLERAQEVNR